MAAQKLNMPAADLTTDDGMMRRKAGGTGSLGRYKTFYRVV
jgi:hypothetical protein